MNGKRILGQIFLWAGFLSAALGAVSQREIDLLPEQERTSLLKLNSKLSLPAPKYKQLFQEIGEGGADASIEELSSAELDTFIEKANKLYEEELRMAEEAKKAEAAKSKEVKDNEKDKNEAKEKVKVVKAKKIIDDRLNLVENKWPTIPWLWYGLSMLVGVVGVVLLRATSKSAEQDADKVTEEFDTLTTSLDRITSSVATLNSNLDKMAPAEIVHYIDNECAEHFANFADSRNSLTQRFGLQAFADIMTEFASAERFINRSWSAAADGYINEVRTSVARSQAHLKRANQLINDQLSKPA